MQHFSGHWGQCKCFVRECKVSWKNARMQLFCRQMQIFLGNSKCFARECKVSQRKANVSWDCSFLQECNAILLWNAKFLWWTLMFCESMQGFLRKYNTSEQLFCNQTKSFVENTILLQDVNVMRENATFPRGMQMLCRRLHTLWEGTYRVIPFGHFKCGSCQQSDFRDKTQTFNHPSSSKTFKIRGMISCKKTMLFLCCVVLVDWAIQEDNSYCWTQMCNYTPWP